MLSLLMMRIENSRLVQPSEGTSHLFILFLLLMLIRFYLFLSRRPAPFVSSLSSSKETSLHHCIQNVDWTAEQKSPR